MVTAAGQKTEPPPRDKLLASNQKDKAVAGEKRMTSADLGELVIALPLPLILMFC